MRSRRSRTTKISGSDPPLTAGCTAYPTQPFLPFFHPPIELTGFGPGGRVHLDRRINRTSVRLAVPVRMEVHAPLEHVGDSGGRASPGAQRMSALDRHRLGDVGANAIESVRWWPLP